MSSDLDRKSHHPAATLPQILQIVSTTYRLCEETDDNLEKNGYFVWRILLTDVFLCYRQKFPTFVAHSNCTELGAETEKISMKPNDVPCPGVM